MLPWTHTLVIGDRWRDIEAGQNVGCKTVFLDFKYDEIKPKEFSFLSNSILKALEWIIKDINIKYYYSD